MNIETPLYEEILSELEALKKHDAGSAEHKAILDEVAKLLDKAAEIEKIHASTSEKDAVIAANEKLKLLELENSKELKNLELENSKELKNLELELEREMKQKQLDEDRKDRLARHWIAGITFGVSTVTGLCMTLKGLKFEETGTICSPLVRSWITKWIPKR